MKINNRLIQFHTALFVLLWSINSFGAGGGGAFGNEGGVSSVWNYAGKTGIGTSYEQYLNKQYSDAAPTGTVSKVWFSIARGIVTETAHGLIHAAQIRDLQFLITGNGFFDEEKAATNSQTEYLHTDGAGRPLSLAYRIVNMDKEGKYEIEKHVFTDPDRQTLFMRVKFTAHENNITPFILINPHMKNTGNGDVAYVSSNYLNAREGHDKYLSLKSTAPFVKTSAGFVGESDGWTDLHDNGVMDWEFDWADKGRGNVAMMAQLQTLNSETITFDIAVGFGATHAEALSQVDGSLGEGYGPLLNKYNGLGGAVGWEDYISSLSNLPSLISFTGDNGKLLYASALVLKAMEDKTHAGALIASLSIPWGDTVSAEDFQTGYRAVWVRDFYQVATAFMAIGDNETALVAYEYLPKVQVSSGTQGIHSNSATGWFLQKTHVNGTQEWYQVQMDQTAMPIMLGWSLWQAGVITDTEISIWYFNILKPAAEFLANGGHVHIHGDSYNIQPPFTKQERWEEQMGYSPSTTASVITGLITAADIARKAANDPGAAAFYETKADEFESSIANFMFTTAGVYGDNQYFLRITRDKDPNDGDSIEAKNGQPAHNEKEVLDAGFLELVRYGVRAANHPSITESLPEIDDMSRSDDSRLKYEFNFGGSTVYPGWRRYAKGDGYGERKNSGSNFTGDNPENRGRVWPIFTGERGHYELERIKADNGGTISDEDVTALRDTYVQAMEHFANEGYMLPEQVWDGVGSNATHNFVNGEGTNSATPLAWSHAEYVKLVRTLADKNTWNSYQILRDRYQGVADGFQKTFHHLFFRGTPNSWGTTAMNLVADFTWEISVSFGSASNERFKVDVHGDWSHNYGDNPPQDGIGDPYGADIPVTGGAGSYTITFNDQTKAYTVVKN